ncbi:MAG: glycosyltransferase family 4 protein [Planctomycetota bacterium]
MNLLMVSGDRQVVVGEKGPFWSMQREFSRHFGRVDVLCPKPSGDVVTTTIHGNVHFHPAPVARAGVSGGGAVVRWIGEAGARLVREHGAALVVSHDYGSFTNGRGAWRVTQATGVPFVSELHHVQGHPVARDARERFEKLLTRLYVAWAKPRALGFRVVNATEMPALLRTWGVPDDKVHVLPSQYLDLAVFTPPADGAPHEVAQDVVFAGRAVANKRVDVLVEALARLKERGRPTSALLIGKGPLRPKIEALARARGVEVRFVDWVAEPADLARHYRASRVCVCASTCEGGPRFTVEAMACGVPVVSTAVGIMPDLLSDGAAGRSVGWSVEELAQGLDEVLRDEAARRAMGAEAARRVQRFEYHAALAGYANGLKALVGAAPEPARLEAAR